MKLSITSIIAAFAMAFASSANSASPPVANAIFGPVVNTIYGPVKGTLTPGVIEFLGVRYAAPPTGNLRWTPPQPPTRWFLPMNATQFGNACPQEETSPFPAVPTSEDCLFLNVYVPTRNLTNLFKRFPVMVWIHGGSLFSGASNYFDPTPLVKQDVIVVSINYRLGFLGFLAHPALSAETAYGGSGNYGLMDQQFAMSWVGRNIAAFGGNPHNVTIFGESASVLAHMASPTAAGLFSRAIAETGVNNLGLTFNSRTSAEAIGTAFANDVGCQTTDCLRSIDLQNLLDRSGEFFPDQAFVPDVDGNVLTQAPDVAFQSGQFNRVPVINGTNHDEYRYFLRVLDFDDLEQAAGGYDNFLSSYYGPLLGGFLSVYYPLADYQNNFNIAYATLVTDGYYSCSALDTDQALSQHVRTYAYEFADENAPPILPPVGGLPQGSEYFSEAQYLFNVSALGEPTVPFTASQQLLSNTMIRYWTDFATSGNPNQTGLSYWPSFSGPPAQQNFLSLVPPSPVVEPESAFSTDHQCVTDRLPLPFNWLYFIGGVQASQ
jgi:para-nitrobenzyl esterase